MESTIEVDDYDNKGEEKQEDGMDISLESFFYQESLSSMTNNENVIENHK